MPLPGISPEVIPADDACREGRNRAVAAGADAQNVAAVLGWLKDPPGTDRKAEPGATPSASST
ncbi:MAG: hypothetical protein LBQ79_08030 [Deltaproteobacteria bacterium]|nr:hypothetical protein [Deltaproteobacteria bacterium]